MSLCPSVPPSVGRSQKIEIPNSQLWSLIETWGFREDISLIPRTIKCLTFSESQAQAKLNDDDDKNEDEDVEVEDDKEDNQEAEEADKEEDDDNYQTIKYLTFFGITSLSRIK